MVYELPLLSTLYLRFNRIKTVSPSIRKLEVGWSVSQCVCVCDGGREGIVWCALIRVLSLSSATVATNDTYLA